MWLRIAIYVLAALFIWRAIRRFMMGVSEGMGRVPPRPRDDNGVRMARDPVCGTFVIPGSALAVRDGEGRLHHFCSSKCRDTFIAQAQKQR